ncbi:MAG: hypothetical protein ACTSPG_02075 [Candidatus Hodarchaeales archaeon]
MIPNGELGFEQQTFIFFLLASFFMFATLVSGKKRWFVLSITQSIVFVWPSYVSFYVEEISSSLWGQTYAPLHGAYFFLFGIFLNCCILLYLWKKQSSSKISAISPLEYRCLGIFIYGFVISSLLQNHPINLALRDFFPFLIPLIDLIEYSGTILFILFVGQFLSGLWLISSDDLSDYFFSRQFLWYIFKIGFYWFMLGIIVASLDHYEDIEYFPFNVLSAFLGTGLILIFEIFTWAVGATASPILKSKVNRLNNLFRIVMCFFGSRLRILFSRPETSFLLVISLGYVLGYYLVHNEILNPLLNFWKASQVVYQVKFIVFTFLWVLLGQLLALRQVSSDQVVNMTRNNLIIFLIAQQLNFWDIFISNWISSEESFSQIFMSYLQSSFVLRISELFIAISLLLISIIVFNKYFNKDHI